MTLRRLRLFVEVAEKGSISEVARSLFISQASVSQSIAEIEKEYNVRLFERLSKRLQLTPIGQQLLVYAKQMLNCEQNIDSFLLQSSKEKKLHVGASLTIGTAIMSDLVAEMNRLYPDVDVRVVVARNALIQAKLSNNELDLGLGDVPPKNNDLLSIPFSKDRLALVCYRGHRFWGRKSVRLEDLSGEKLVIRDSSSEKHTMLEQMLLERQIPHSVSWLCSDTEASKRAVLRGHGISTISTRLIQDEVARGDLWPVEIVDADITRTFNVLYHKDKYLTDYMQAFIHLAENVDEICPMRQPVGDLPVP